MNKPIILASASPQRKKLLRMAGLKFTVRPSRAEESTDLSSGCEALVKHNALIKAQEVAGRIKDGLVIGADTVVYGGEKNLILKPRDLREARRILRQLFSRPHWVYTGLAVIDARSGRREIACEKTKIYMHKLSDHEINRYHRVTSPLDKAGGFDIEGRGGLFINRIEGCYSNVIGLPLAKLRLVLKKFGVSLLGLAMVCLPAVSFTGCASEFNLATGEQEMLMVGTDQEIKVGDAVAHQMEKQFKIIEDVDVNERVQQILDRIVAVCDRQDIIYSIKVIDEESLNAVSLPGGYIYVFKGMYDAVQSDDELAGVIAHEVGHVTAKHGVKRMQASYGYAFLQVLSVASGSADAAVGANALFTTVFLAHARGDEFQADKLGVKYLKAAGYDPNAMLGVLKRLDKKHRKDPDQPMVYFRTHPYINERMAIVNKEITGQLDFKGYLNVTGHDEVEGIQ